MNRGQNNPTNFRRKETGSRSSKMGSLAKVNYPLDNREEELRGEINSPTIPTVYKRIMTIDNESVMGGGEGGITSETSHNPSVTKYMDGPPETWDSVAPLSEDNVHAKFVKLGVEPEDANLPADYGNSTQD